MILDSNEPKAFQGETPPPKPSYLSQTGTACLALVDRLQRYRPYFVALLVASMFFLGSYTIYDRFIATHPVSVQVSAFKWNREIAVDLYQTNHEGDWSIPDHGRKTGEEWRYHYSYQIIVGYNTTTYYYQCGQSTCSGTNSTPIYQSIAVYDWYYFYDIDRWNKVSPLVSTGTDQEPYWPTIPDNFSPYPVLGSHRIGASTSVYSVRFVNGKSATTSLEKFQCAYVDQVLTGHQTNSGNLRSVDWKSCTPGVDKRA